LGYSLADLLGIRFLDIIHPEDLETSVGALAALRSPLDSAFFTSRFRRRDGSYRWLEWRATARDGLIYGAARDVTGYKIAEASLRENAEKFATAFNVQSDAFYISDIESGHFMEVNHGFERLTGYSRDEAIGHTSTELGMWYEPADRGRFFDELKNKGGVRGFLAKLTHRNGLVWWGELSADPVAIGGRACIITTTRDVTERIQYENNLKESEARFRGIFEQVPVGVALLDQSSGRFINSNQHFCEILGYTPEELGQVHLPGILHPDDLPLVLGAARDQRGIPVPIEARFLRKDGGLGWASVSIRPLEASHQAKRHSVVVFEDLTQRKQVEGERLQLEKQLSRSQRMESLGSLASGVAHDMNNVLGAVMTLAGANRLELPDGSELAEDMEAIVTSCERGRQLVRGLLDFARQDLPTTQAVDLNKLVREQARMLERTLPHAIHIKVEAMPRLGKILGDPAAMAHALMNLCVNAMDAMPEGGTLTLGTTTLPDGRIELFVRDTGQGMSKEVLDKALDPFFTTKPAGKGTGLGLPIVYSTVKAHQGQLEIESSPAQGTQIHLRFPALPRPDADPHASDASLPQVTGLRILLVEDDELIRQSVANQLRRLGHATLTACDGQQAIDQLAKNPAVDLVILDMTMPVMDGYTALPKLRALRPGIPVVIATGKVDATIRELPERFADTHLLLKPFNLSDLRAALAPYAERAD
jgi:two-component system cell cycle sensor histidine kinase/response regulator CckA